MISAMGFVAGGIKLFSFTQNLHGVNQLLRTSIIGCLAQGMIEGMEICMWIGAQTQKRKFTVRKGRRLI